MEANLSEHRSAVEVEWLARERDWQRKLGRIRLGAEPIDDQVSKYRRVTWMLTAVAFGVATMFVTLFTVFRRPDVGLVMAGVLLLPVISIAWIDFGLLRLRVARYQRDYEAFHKPPKP